LHWLDRIPWTALLPIAILLALAPFTPEPHLWEKTKILIAGQLSRPIDIFDLVLHGSGLVLSAWKLLRRRAR